MKLSPDWGAGQCQDCLRHTAPKAKVVRASFGTAFLLAFLALNGVGAFVAFMLGLARGEAIGTLVGSAIWSIVCIGGSIVIFRNSRR